ncbi:hypothetical protein AG0111_0g1537 [Alternaria gaisen]|uniref:Uncharacterized protein n=1 Tax=Alternaria gaisen TaxID=167740 RepID=A0ACB6FZG0_9PLEO|nr:hypothetical protein AG0111_0g1537 [Alternaria gaisen]
MGAPEASSSSTPTYEKYGLIQLWPENNEIGDTRIDLIALPGLDTSVSTDDGCNHTIETFTAKNKKLWLRDFLPEDLPNVRVMDYGYSAKVVSHEDNTLFEEAEKLLRKLERKRIESGGDGRPIFLLGYSLGGILLKQALVRAFGGDDTFRAVTQNIYCIMFMGTPHKGANNATLASTVLSVTGVLSGGKIDSSWISTLEKLSDSAQMLRENYRHLLEKYQIVSIYELQKYHGRLVVEKDSASMDLAGTREYKVSMRRNHIELCKFDRKDDDYESFLDSMKSLTEKAMVAAERRKSHPGHALGDPIYEMVAFNTMKDRESKDYVGRTSELSLLREMLHVDVAQDYTMHQSRVALYGPAGAGKTELAVKICHEVLRSVKTSVFWVYATSNAGIQRAFVEYAELVGIYVPTAESLNADKICKRMQAWLEGPRSGIWVLVLDGMDDLDLEARQYIPNRNGNIIVTTKKAHILGDLVGVEEGILVDQMKRADALDLFQRLSRVDLHEPSILEDAESLLTKLDYLALPITQAAALIRHDELRVSEYIRLFDQSQEDKQTVLSRAAGYTWNEEARPSKTIITTWKITFDRLHEAYPASLELLSKMAFLDPMDMRRDMFAPTENKGQLKDFLDAMRPLRSYSLVDKLEQDAYRMHSLVSLCTRMHLAEDNSVPSVIRATIDIVVSAMPDDEADQRAMYTLTHALTISDHVLAFSKHESEKVRGAHTAHMEDRTDSDVTTPALGTLEYRLGKYLFRRGNYKAAISHGMKAHEVLQNTYSTQEHDYLDILESIARAHWNMNNFEMMREWLFKALSEKEKRYGHDDERTLDTVGRIASYYHFAGHLSRSLEWHRRDLEGKEKIFVEGDTRFIKTWNNIGGVLYLMGNYPAALGMHDRAFENALKSKNFPKSTMDDLKICRARDLSKLGRSLEARKILEAILAGREQEFGPDHPGSARAVEDIGETFLDEKNYEKAEEWYLNSLARYKNAHLAIGQILSNIGELYKRKANEDPSHRQSDYEESYRYTTMTMQGKEQMSEDTDAKYRESSELWHSLNRQQEELIADWDTEQEWQHLVPL